MKKITILCLILNSSILFGQNLVPNPSFEYHTRCPFDTTSFPSGFLLLAYPWQNPSTVGNGDSSPDLFDTCSTNVGFSVPNNAWGNEYPHTGNAYSGIYCYYKWILSREYIQVQLIDSLQKKTPYCVEFYVSLADVSTYAANNIGAYFSVDAISMTGYSNLPYIPQVINSNNNLLINKHGWKKVSGSFIANGGEKYITIGNFNDDPSTDTIFVDSTGWDGGIAYYYIDDVSIMDCRDTTGIENYQNSSTINIYPNPTSDILTIVTPIQSTIQISNIQGQLIKTLITTGTKTNNDVSSLPSGVYIVEVKTDKGVAVKKFVKE